LRRRIFWEEKYDVLTTTVVALVLRLYRGTRSDFDLPKQLSWTAMTPGSAGYNQGWPIGAALARCDRVNPAVSSWQE